VVTVDSSGFAAFRAWKNGRETPDIFWKAKHYGHIQRWLSEAVHPGMEAFHNPSAWNEVRVTLRFGDFLTLRTDVRDSPHQDRNSRRYLVKMSFTRSSRPIRLLNIGPASSGTVHPCDHLRSSLHAMTLTDFVIIGR
jgi:hypothetical protein